MVQPISHPGSSILSLWEGASDISFFVVVEVAQIIIWLYCAWKKLTDQRTLIIIAAMFSTFSIQPPQANQEK